MKHETRYIVHKLRRPLSFTTYASYTINKIYHCTQVTSSWTHYDVFLNKSLLVSSKQPLRPQPQSPSLNHLPHRSPLLLLLRLLLQSFRSTSKKTQSFASRSQCIRNLTLPPNSKLHLPSEAQRSVTTGHPSLLKVRSVREASELLLHSLCEHRLHRCQHRRDIRKLGIKVGRVGLALDCWQEG